MQPPHALVADTDALIALADSAIWSKVSKNVGISTTNVCLDELKNFSRDWDGHGMQGDQQARQSKAADRVIDALRGDSAIKMHMMDGCRNGEHSIMKLVQSNLDYVEGIIMMDSGENDEYDLGGRKLIRHHINLEKNNVTFQSPTFPIAILADNGLISPELFCKTTQRIMVREDWKSYSAIKRMWEGIPVDCSGHIDEHYLPGTTY